MVVGRRRRRVVRRHPGCELDPPVVVVASKKLQHVPQGKRMPGGGGVATGGCLRWGSPPWVASNRLWLGGWTNTSCVASDGVELSSCNAPVAAVIGGKTHTACVVSTAVSTIPNGHCVDTLGSQSQPACVVKRMGHRNSVSGAREWSCKCAGSPVDCSLWCVVFMDTK